MNTNLSFAGHFQENLLHYQKIGLQELRIIRGGRTIVSIDTTNESRAYVTLMKAINFNDEVPSLSNNIFQNHYVHVFDMTSLQDSGENIHYAELSGESIRFKKFFDQR